MGLKLSIYEQGQVKHGQQMKILQECPRRMFFVVIWHVEFVGVIYFLVDPMKGYCLAKFQISR